ncbi:hypothetical protein [Spongiactinospora sp. TRM90649]|uniref:hypothetical protein n=1 Tax=Spongiactinospora sp. TRM90649 TaxID=3031114 RepID=UPI0023F6DE50|nr:hypothetical protein [Spongiactinospora sp. TRM90649]MDF5752228.1 hypothetical protein [Spongiactinospora sp. TRM90649]
MSASSAPSTAGRSPRPQADTRPSAPHRVNRVLVGIIAALSLVIVAGAGTFVYTQIIQGDPGGRPSATEGAGTPPTTKTAEPAGVFTGVDTYTENCPAAKISGAAAACVRESECWGGLVIIVGDTKARRLGCEETHSWETFAVAPIPKDAETYVQQDLAKHPTVKRVCARSVLMASRVGSARTIAASNWQADVMPPSQAQFDAGTRFYRCIGTVTGQETRGSYFR